MRQVIACEIGMYTYDLNVYKKYSIEIKQNMDAWSGGLLMELLCTWCMHNEKQKQITKTNYI